MECDEDYILLKNNNTCLYRENNELEEFDSCLELRLSNNKLICSRCKPRFSLLKEEICLTQQQFSLR